MTVTCPKCETEMELDIELAGRQIECPACRALLSLPRAEIGPGSLVGEFRIQRWIGPGGLGDVYLARQLSPDRDVALEILPPCPGRARETVERFLRKVRRLSRLQHPNIVAPYDAGEDSGMLYVAMRWVGGESLEMRLQSREPMEEVRTLLLARKLVAALAYAWTEHHQVHGDIRPRNVLLDSSGELLLAEFGLAASLNPQTPLADGDKMPGTTNYRSPEQGEGATELDYRTDVYSLGVTLYQMLTGTVPFQGATAGETSEKSLTETLPDPRTVAASLSGTCVTMLEHMLARSRENRYSSWEALAEDMTRALAGRMSRKAPLEPGQSVLVRRAAATGAGASKREAASKLAARQRATVKPPRVTKPGRRSVPTLTIAAGVLAAAMAVGTVFLIRSASRAKAPPSTRTAVVRPAAPGPAPVTVRTEAAPKAPAMAPSAAIAAANAMAAAEMRLVGLRDKLTEAQAWTRDNPADYAGALARLASVRREAGGTEVEERAAQDIALIERKMQNEIEGVVRRLKADAEVLFAQGLCTESKALLQGYSGPWAEETLAARAAIAGEIAKRPAPASAMAAKTPPR